MFVTSFESEGAFFRPWRDIVPAFEYNNAVAFHHLIVPTVDTARFSFVARRLLNEGRPVFLGGVSGTGKSLVLSSLMSNMSGDPASGGDNVFPITINFSARSSAEVTQMLIESKMIRKHADLLSPPVGKQVRSCCSSYCLIACVVIVVGTGAECLLGLLCCAWISAL